MSRTGIFALAAQRLDWLAVRRELIATNIANAATPGYRSRDVQPFAAHRDEAAERSVLVSTNARHLDIASGQSHGATDLDDVPGATVHSGNGVNLDRELLKAGEIARAQQLSIGVVRAFHRLSMMAVKG